MPKKYMPLAAAFAPNYKFKDWLIAVAELLPWAWPEWQDGKHVKELENDFAKYMQTPVAVSFLSGRAGLRAILKSLSVQEGDEVILQAFTTVALVNTIKHIGATPVFVDIKNGTFNLNPEELKNKITSRTKAIIVQHTFGSPALIENIMEITREQKIAIIEDCAHSLGAIHAGKKLGTWGDAAFFSFGRDKVISSVSGGMVIASDPALGAKIRQEQNTLTFPDARTICKNLLHPVIMLPALFTYNLYGLGKSIMFLAYNLNLLDKAYSQTEKKGAADTKKFKKLPNALARLALNQMNYLENFNAHRREIAEIYAQTITNSRVRKFPLAEGGVPLWFTVTVENKDETIAQALKENIILGDWFPQAVGPEEVNLRQAAYTEGSCPQAEKLARICVNLPTHHNITPQAARQIAKFMNQI